MRSTRGALASLVLSLASCAAPRPAAESPAVLAPSGAPPPAARCRVFDLPEARGPVQLTAYFSRGLPADDAFVDSLTAALERIVGVSRGQATLEVVTPRAADEKAAAQAAGLAEHPLGREGSEGGPSGFRGIAFEYAGQQDKIGFLPVEAGTDDLAYWIATKVRGMAARASGAHVTIGVVTGHDEIRLSDANLVPGANGSPTLAKIVAQYFEHVQLVDLDLRQPAATDPSGVLVLQPARDWSEPELRALDDLVLRGVPVTVIASAVNLRAGDATMHATLSTHGLERVLGGYGIQMARDVVLSPGKGSYTMLVMTQGGQSTLQLPQLPVVTREDGRLHASHPAFHRLRSLTLPFASSLTLLPSRQPGARLHALAHSSPASWRVVGGDLDFGISRVYAAPKGHGSALLAASAEGTLVSAFDPRRTSVPDARVLVIGSSQMTANPFVRAAPAPDLPNLADDLLLQVASPYAQASMTDMILAFANLLDWMAAPLEARACARPAVAP